MLFAYFAPEVILPMASVLVAGFGFIMMVGRAPFRFVARRWRAGLRGIKRMTTKPNTQAKQGFPNDQES